MMIKRNIIIRYAFLVLLVLQAAVPLYMVWRWEQVRSMGEVFLWKTAPVDPYDPLRGRYLNLHFVENSGPVAQAGAVNYGEYAYGLLARHEDGTAYISQIVPVKPAAGAYIRGRILQVDGMKATLELPFTRYYLPEERALALEARTRQRSLAQPIAAVRIQGGYAVIEDLYIDELTLPGQGE